MSDSEVEMMEYEYEVEDCLDALALKRILEKYGPQGWRVVAMTQDLSSGTYTVVLAREHAFGAP